MKWIGFARDAVMAFVLIFLFSSCGGGGNNSSGVNNSPAAPNNLAGQTLALNGNASREVLFASSGNVWTEHQNGTVSGGTYQYSASGNVAEVLLTESGVGSTLRLTFTTPESGAYTVGTDQGAFRLQQTQDSPDEPVPDAPGDEQGLAPASLDGAVLYGTRTYTTTGPSGQTHVYTFSGNSFHDSDPPEESDGSYVYDPVGDRATLTLNYYAPAAFNGDWHVLELAFATEGSGTFESVYTRRDGTTIQINGNFRIE